jgi:Tfp pilus assembly protein PilN
VHGLARRIGVEKGDTVSLIVTVPAELVGALRNALHSVLGEAAEEVSAVSVTPDRERHPERYQEPRMMLEGACGLLDMIGWVAPSLACAAQIDLVEHRAVLLRGLEVMLDLADAELADVEAVEARRAARREASVRAATIERVRAQHEFAEAVKDLVSSSEAREVD